MEELDPEMWADLAERVASVANDIPALPAFPGAAARVLSMARDPNLDVNKLCTEVQRDAGIASTLLRVANSAAFSPASPITTLRSAIQMLGCAGVVERIRNHRPAEKVEKMFVRKPDASSAGEDDA